MPFGNKAMPTIVYSYLAKPPLEELPRILEELRLANRYRNRLVEIELERRRKYHEILESVKTEAIKKLEFETDSLKAKIDALDEAVSLRNQANQKRSITKEERAEFKLLRSIRSPLLKELKIEREKVKATGVLDQQLEIADCDDLAKRKAARAECGIYWGNYLEIEKSVPHSGPEPRFHRFDGTGKIAVQLQKGLSPEDAYLGQDTRLSITKPPDEAYSKRNRRGRRTFVRMRIGSHDNGRPISTTVPFEMHRLPPNDCSIQWAFLVRRKVKGTQFRWLFQLVVGRKLGWGALDAANSGSVGIDVGWRVIRPQDGINERLRVAYWISDNGQEGELSLPIELVNKWEYAEAVQGQRSINFDGARDVLGMWLHNHNSELPIWLQEKSRDLGKWKSENRLADLVYQWNSNRFEGDHSILEIANEWRKQDRHLLHVIQSVREKAMANRNEIYKRFAAQIRRNYSIIAVEDWNIRKSLKDKGVEAGDHDKMSRLYHRIGAPGILRQLLIAKARNPVKIDAKYTTKTCHACGKLDPFDAAEQLSHTCVHCGVTEDQDRRAAINILNGALNERLGDENNPIGARNGDLAST
jgi:putative transposase